MTYKIELMNDVDKDLALAHLKGLNSDDRYTRFSQSMTDDGIESYIKKLDGKKDKCFFIKSDDKIIAFSHLAYFKDSKSGEFHTDMGISVLEDYRKNGFGWKLIKHALEEAKNTMVSKFFMVTMKKNRRMCSLMKKIGDDVVEEDGEVSLTVNLK